MRIGLDAYTVERRGLTAEQTLDFAAERDREGVQFLTPSALDPDLDPGRLRKVRALADARGLALEVGIPSLNPARRSRIEGRTVSPAEHAADLIRQVEGVATLGCHHARVYLGDRHDRFRDDSPWADRELDWLASLAGYLRAVVQMLGRVDETRAGRGVLSHG